MNLTCDALDRAVRSVLVATRTDAGLTQRALAARLGRAHSFIGKIESGTRKTSVGDFVLIAHAVGANPADLIERLLGAHPNERQPSVPLTAERDDDDDR